MFKTCAWSVDSIRITRSKTTDIYTGPGAEKTLLRISAWLSRVYTNIIRPVVHINSSLNQSVIRELSTVSTYLTITAAMYKFNKSIIIKAGDLTS